MPSGYLQHTHSPDSLKTTAKKVIAAIRKIRKVIDFDAIAVRGISGASVGYIASYVTGLPIIQIRKTGEISHGESREGAGMYSGRYIIIDDMICSGDTMREILNHRDMYGLECAAIILYYGVHGGIGGGFEHNGKTIPTFTTTNYWGLGGKQENLRRQLAPYRPKISKKKPKINRPDLTVMEARDTIQSLAMETNESLAS